MARQGEGRRDQIIAQPEEDLDCDPVAGLQQPFLSVHHTAPVGLNEDTDISIRQATQSKQLGYGGKAFSQKHVYAISGSSSSFPLGGESVVDIFQQTLVLNKNVIIRHAGLSQNDLSINVRTQKTTCAVDDSTDLQIREEIDDQPKKEKGYVAYGEGQDILKLLDGTRTQKGIIIRGQQVLHCEDGLYDEGQQYKVIPGTLSRGAYGEAAMCQDLKSGRTFVRKMVKGKLSRNEIEVPLMFRDVGIPQVLGVATKNEGTEIYQEFAGMSLKRLMESAYAKHLCDPRIVLILGFQAFATLDKLHRKGVTHQDIKPENLCLDLDSKSWRLKFIDFGSSQTPKDHVTEGLTNEYLSPESCNTILQVATGSLPKEAGRLGPGTDVWAMALSLLYCLCGYHVMVYACTGLTKYVETNEELQHRRMQCLVQICNLKDEDVRKKLISPGWPEVLKTLLMNTLRVDPQERWSAQQAAQFIYINCIMKNGVAPIPQQLQTQPTAPSSGFTGLTPARLVVRTQALPQAAQDSLTGREVQAVQCTSPTDPDPPPPVPGTPSVTSVSPSLLPAFTDLLSDGTSKKAPRPYKYKQRKGPYTQSARRGTKS